MTQILRRFTAFVEGYDTRLEIEEITPPLVRDLAEEVKAGAMLAPMDAPLGLQKLEASMKLNSRQKALMKQAGITPGKFVSITFRVVSISEIDGGQQNEVLVIKGRLNVDGNSWSANSASTTDYKIGSINYYQHRVDGELLYEIDIINCICIVDGVDQWADLRAGLGL